MREERVESFEENYMKDRLVLKDVLPFDLPLCISIEPSNLCNFKCVMCCHGSAAYEHADLPLKNMDGELFEKCVSQIEEWCNATGKKLKLMKLYSLGEPLLNGLLCDMVKRIKEAGITEQLEITSNAALLTEEIGKKLVDYGLDIFRVSIYSIDSEKNKVITRSGIEPQTIYGNIRKMRDYRDSQHKVKPFISAKMIDSYSDENERFFLKYNEVADEAYLEKIELIGEDTISNYYGDNADIALSDPNRVRVKGVQRRACRYPFTHMTVKSDGHVVVCCADWARKTVIGDVNKNTLREIWNSKALYDFRCMMLKTRGEGHEWCEKCDIPLRGYAEDNIDDFSADKLSYWG